MTKQTEATRSISDWDRFLAEQRPDIGHKQYSWWIDFLKLRGWSGFGFAASEDDVICGGANVLVKSFAPGICFYYVPHGPVLPENQTDAADLFEAMMQYIDDHQRQSSNLVSHLRLEPRWLDQPEFVKGFQQSTHWNEPRNTLCVDLTMSEDAILKQMKTKGRYNIRVARRHNVSVVQDNSPKGLDDFMRLYQETIDRKNIIQHSRGYFDDLAENLLESGRGDLFFAEYQGVRLATSLVLYAGDTVTYKYGGTQLSHRNVMAPYLLHFEVMLHAKALGYKWYDFYGVSPAESPNDKWANFSSFKRKFGGHEMSFVPSLDFIFDHDAYEAYCVQKNG
ncbi:Methicillin resistance protein [Rhodopirellula maiorica SM1]|uniref:Methicillin resistance protein n=1 Tax=Rhodopirellula maiorica SM1 TaxID=1265738 RepID=M5RSG1_9BACT|nr:peptidoglycan bridge formation glycyltransferase FemA/FemB family protein [Rhodopirellula maiorica]EMI22235.1 Methicillin resistance protein [Rhodopirellula maiorica SM1]